MHRDKPRATLVRRVSARRTPLTLQDPVAEQPAPRSGLLVRVHGSLYTVADSYKDRVLLQGEGARNLPHGLLIRWLGWVWRVVTTGDGWVVLEGWGLNFTDSPKLGAYEV